MIRATTGGVLRSYRTNLMSSFIRDNNARETVLTQRVFNSYAEDPAAAAKAFRLRKSRMQASSQLDVCQDAYYKYQGAFASLQKVSQLIDTENGSDLATLKSTTLEMLNDPEGDARVQLNKVLDNLSDTIIQNMNQTYGDDFIFAGADGHNVPFTVEEKDGHKQLFYRGVPVDAAVPKVLEDGNGAAIKVNANGEIDPAGEDYLSADAKLTEVPKLVDGAGGVKVMVDDDGQVSATGTNYLLADTPTLDQAGLDAAVAAGEDIADFSGYTADDGSTHFFRKADAVSMSQDEYQKIQDNAMADTTGQPYVLNKGGKDYYVTKGDDTVITKADYDEATENVEKLDYLMKEKRFIDIGLGLQEDETTGKLIESSAFDESINGLKFLGYGLDADGDPKNVYSIVQRLKEIAANAPDKGKWDQATYDEFHGLVGKLEDAADEFKTQFTNHSAATTKLENNVDLLEDNVYNLKEQYSNLEDVNMADAISSFIWAEYCYNAALKVGNSILSQSLMDYLQ